MKLTYKPLEWTRYTDERGKPAYISDLFLVRREYDSDGRTIRFILMDERYARGPFHNLSCLGFKTPGHAKEAAARSAAIRAKVEELETTIVGLKATIELLAKEDSKHNELNACSDEHRAKDFNANTICIGPKTD